MSTSYSFTLTDEQHAKLLRLGAGRWLRKQIDNAVIETVPLHWSSVAARDRAICEDLRPGKLVAKDYGINRKTVYSIRKRGKLQGWVVHEFEKQTPLKKKSRPKAA